MAIPRKGTRKISVDGKTYRWLFNVDYDYTQKFFIIESIEDNRYQVTGSLDYSLELIISPSIIKQAIQQAREKGWEPGISDVKKIVIDFTKINI